MTSIQVFSQEPGSPLPALPHYDSLGTGILQVSFEEKIPLYASADATVPFDTLEIKRRADGSTAFLTRVLKNKLAPYQLSYGDTHEAGRRHINMGLVSFPPVLQFRVVKATAHHFQVVINEKEKLTCFIYINPKYALYGTLVQKEVHNRIGQTEAPYNPCWYLYETWEHFLQRAYIVSTKPNATFYDAPNGKTIPFPSLQDGCRECFHVARVEGEWAELIDRQDYSRKKPAYGWVKWQNGKTLEVAVMEFGYE
ncbi:hypothetical protein [Chitinophaga sp. HK235]|uniref:hypothetical protein n=1 Tax=Chitinophaga sp. HK235 TaxID=2952571 RepID=UPI001BA79839|nr:hypothetical protein [Chitinophaga sp. HK235]